MLSFEKWLTTNSGMFVILLTAFLILYFPIRFVNYMAERNNVSNATVVKVFLIIALGIFASIIFAPIIFILGIYKSAKKEWRQGMTNFHNKKGFK